MVYKEIKISFMRKHVRNISVTKLSIIENRISIKLNGKFESIGGPFWNKSFPKRISILYINKYTQSTGISMCNKFQCKNNRGELLSICGILV